MEIFIASLEKAYGIVFYLMVVLLVALVACSIWFGYLLGSGKGCL